MIDYTQTPFLVIWEVTQACDLVCKHCRASAQRSPLPGELSLSEGKRLLCAIHEMGTGIVVFSGGDPAKRKDLLELIRHGKTLGLRIATIPAATDLLTYDFVLALRDAGLDQMALSLDFPEEKLHDSFRDTPGAWAKTMEAIQWAHDIGLPIQINTTITALSLPYLRTMLELVSSLTVVFWEVFFLVPVGRGANLQALNAQQCESAFSILYKGTQTSTFVLKVTEAPHYRRFVAQQEGGNYTLPDRLRISEGPGGTLGLAPQAVNAARGFLFVSYSGDIFPSGFLPLSAGNIRSAHVSDVYRHSSLFQSLRDYSQLKGICSSCRFRDMCGGSRSRAYALTGDYLAAEPWCAYVPDRS